MTNQEIHVKLAGITLDPRSKSPVILLRDESEERVLPIWVGPFEANAIIAEREHLPVPRPLTHDLLKRVILSMGHRLQRLVITAVKDNIYYAELHLTGSGGETIVDCRPSDGIALALRFNAELYVNEEVLVHEETKQHAELLNLDSLSSFIENLSPDDFEGM